MKCYLPSFRLVLLLQAIMLLLGFSRLAMGHEQTRAQFEANRQVALAQARENSEKVVDSTGASARLTVDLWDKQSGKRTAGLVQVTNVDTGKAVELEDQIHRELNWFSVPTKVELKVPRAKLRVDAFHGIETERVSQTIDLTEKEVATLEFKLPRIYNSRAQGVISGNTHLHLKKLSYGSAMRYLDLVPKSDGLDVVFLSHLRRMPDERTYISNLIVENSFNGRGDLAKLSQQGVLFGNGEEHRHNFDSNIEGYGHVMLLNLKKLIRPISIGPDIMRSGTDGRPIQRGIREARGDGATIVWCHGRYGLEDVPNWVEGLIHAQNVFDGGSSGGYDGSFYKYLNLGLKVPFSTGTDWFICDFSRVYVPIESEVTTDQWLQQLRAGRSYITNGTFLEFQVDDRPIGDTISLESPSRLKIKGRAVGRLDFGNLELIFNGEVVHSVESQKSAGHFVAEMDFDFEASEPGWLALAIPRNVAKNELDNELFAHTSPIYLELAGKKVFQTEVAQSLIEEVEQNLGKISSGGIFDPGEEETVMKVHRQGLAQLKKMLEAHQADE
jgi:hypothetical protein